MTHLRTARLFALCALATLALLALAPLHATEPVSTSSAEASTETQAPETLPLFLDDPTAAAATCSAQVTCRGGQVLSCSDPGGSCSSFRGCWVICGCQVQECPDITSARTRRSRPAEGLALRARLRLDEFAAEAHSRQTVRTGGRHDQEADQGG